MFCCYLSDSCYFVRRDRKGGEGNRRSRGRETVIRIYCTKKESISNKRGNVCKVLHKTLFSLSKNCFLGKVLIDNYCLRPYRITKHSQHGSSGSVGNDLLCEYEGGPDPSTLGKSWPGVTQACDQVGSLGPAGVQ